MRILVVDDDPLAGEMIGALLEFQGHEILLANDAMEATSQLDAHDNIALIVSDMHMPLVNGIELLSMLRKQGVTLPFILLTGDTPDESLRQTPGLSACLQKDAALDTALEHAVAQAVGE
ncbi:response regulator [Vreelandella sp.]|uniref:response regulator n=1 Tax=Vreelandella sp. TaxID=3137778 RepID=UPI003BA860C5